MKNKIIGVIVPELKHPFFAAILDGIEVVAFQYSCAVVVGQSREKVKREKQVVQKLVENGIQGLLISVSEETRDANHLKIVHDAGIPIVYFDRVLDDEKASRVIIDDYEGAFKATEHLILAGYERIAHLAAYQYLSIGKLRYQGYIAAMREYGMQIFDEYVIWGGLSERFGIDGVKKLLKLPRKPDAIFAVNDPVAMGVLYQLHKAGLKISADIGLIGFSDNPVVSVIETPLTTIVQPRYEIGQTAIRILIDYFLNPDKGFFPITKVLKTKLVIRQTT
ncbi:MAG: LacI family transcriptional regulator [Calditrichaeota bacterium]|nr:LacI family transcriptional regulator [Calditrichota bacterium]